MSGRRSRLRRSGAIAAICTLLAASQCSSPFEGDPLLAPDLWNFATGEVLELATGVPYFELGPDEDFGTADDVVVAGIEGDVDLVVRVAPLLSGDAFRTTTAPAAAAVLDVAPFGQGTPLSFEVGASSAAWLPELGSPVAPESLEGAPIVVAAFADLDGDGFIGATHLDGDPGDTALEQAEWLPVGRALAIASDGVASGLLRVEAGGPPGAPLTVLLGAAGWAGRFDPAFAGGIVPRGPLVATQLPFWPNSDPEEILPGGFAPITPGAGFEVEIEDAFEPNPLHPVLGEAFTLPVDGSAPTNDLARANSGEVAAIGLARLPDPARYEALRARPLRPALDASQRVLVEVLPRAPLPDDGTVSQASFRLVPLDVLGNVASLSSATLVVVRSTGTTPAHIVEPDLDGDPFSETLLVAPGSLPVIHVDDAGASFDDASDGALIVEALGTLRQIPLLSPDPDPNDDGVVDAEDLALVAAARGARQGEIEFDEALDVDASGRIDDADQAAVAAALGLEIAVP